MRARSHSCTLRPVQHRDITIACDFTKGQSKYFKIGVTFLFIYLFIFIFIYFLNTLTYITLVTWIHLLILQTTTLKYYTTLATLRKGVKKLLNR